MDVKDAPFTEYFCSTGSDKKNNPRPLPITKRELPERIEQWHG